MSSASTTVALVSGDATGITDNGDGTFSIDPSAYNALAVGESAIINYTYDVVESDDAGTELSRTATTAQITISGQQRWRNRQWCDHHRLRRCRRLYPQPARQQQ